MHLPFTVEQFFAVFQQYNTAVWPAQLFLLSLGVIAASLVIWPRPKSGVFVSAILAALWAWTGIVYHILFFRTINPLAPVFAVGSVLGALAFLWFGVVLQRVHFARTRGWRAWAGGSLLVYALVVYPALSVLTGHQYVDSPTFGLPCPTTIFTMGVLMFLAKPYPRVALVVPILWSLIGAQAAFLLGVRQDLALLAAAALGLIMALRSQASASYRDA
jgi:hypothetical protein